MTTEIDRSRLKMLTEREEQRHLAEHPKSAALFERAKGSLFTGAPYTWQSFWMFGLPLFIEEGRGAYLTDVDGHRYLDLFLVDHGALYGHSPKAFADAIAEQVYRGTTFGFPTEDSIWVGEELTRRFGLPSWQIFMTATDANRAAMKIAREVTQRELVLCFNGSYHGALDETLVSVVDGKLIPHPYGGATYNIGPLPNPESRTRVVESEDLDALEKVLSSRDIACVITEPTPPQTIACGYIPDPGYHEALREITRRYGTLLIYDETHSIVAGPGGCTRLWNLEPDFFVLGKGISGGFPAAVMGLTQEVAEKALPLFQERFVQGIGTTTSGSALAVVALRATLEHVMTESAYDRMISGAERMADGMDKVIKAADLPWCVDRVGCRVRLNHSLTIPKSVTERGPEQLGIEAELGRFHHTFYRNRGILILGAFGMISPEVTDEDIDFHTKVFGEYVNELV